MTPDDFVDRQDLIDQVMNQIKQDVEDGDFTAIEQMITRLRDRELIAYLPERN